MLTTLTAAPLMAPPQTAAEPARKVVVLVASAETQAALWGWATAAGFDLGASFGGEPRDPRAFEFHLTLFATVGPSALPEQQHASFDALAYVFADGFDALGSDADTPVLTIEDTDGDLASLRAEWLAAAAAEPTYPDFKPHVSLSYAWTGTPALADLDPPPFLLVFDRLEVRTLDAPPPTVDQVKAARIERKDALYTLVGLLRVFGTLGLFGWALYEVGSDIVGLTRDGWRAISDWLFGERDRLVARRAELEAATAPAVEELAAIDARLAQLDEAEAALAEVDVTDPENPAAPAVAVAAHPAPLATKSADDLRLDDTIRAALAGIPAAAPLLDEHDVMVEALRRLQSGQLDSADMDAVTAITQRLDQIETDLAALL